VTGAELRAIRLRLGLSQDEMGQELDLSLNTIWRYERRGRGEVPRWLSLAVGALKKQPRRRARR